MRFVRPSKIDGMLAAPASKSLMQRAIAAGLLAKGTTELLYPTFCDDALAAMGVARALGADIFREGNRVFIQGTGKDFRPQRRVITCGESGLCLRMFAPIAALCDRELLLDGDSSLRKRPVSMITETFQSLGVTVETENGFPPIKIRGPLQGGEAVTDGSTTSQFLTGLLMALPLCLDDSRIRVINLKSTDYVRMTISLLGEFGIGIEHSETLDDFTIRGNQRYRAVSLTLEGDWSGAAFLLVAGALAGKVSVTNLNIDSNQADRMILEALDRAGVYVETDRDMVTVYRGDLEAFEFDASDCPDLFPPLVALASGCRGKTVLHGAERLRYKECDRADALASEFTKMGVPVEVYPDRLEITGTRPKGGKVFSHHDHRIAMACAVGALKSEQGVEIEDWEAVTKSYPEFFEDLERIQVNP